MIGRNVSMEGKKKIVLSSQQSCASETWTWNAAQQSQVRTVEMSYMRGACGVSRLDGESNEDMYERFGMSEAAVGMDSRVIELVKRSTLIWYGHDENE